MPKLNLLPFRARRVRALGPIWHQNRENFQLATIPEISPGGLRMISGPR